VSPAQWRFRLQRVPDEDGFSLVELLVAIFVFGLVLMAVTGVFVSAAHSIGEQRLRTAATRLATDRLETLRGVPLDDLEAEAGTQPATVTAHGRDFQIVTAVAAIDAVTGAPADAGAVKKVSVTVSRDARGTARQVLYTTAIAGDDPAAAVTGQAIGTVTMFPNPVVTDGSGRRQEDIQVTVPLEGFPTSTPVDLSWTNGDGSAGARTLTSTTGLNWRGTTPETRSAGPWAPTAAARWSSACRPAASSPPTRSRSRWPSSAHRRSPRPPSPGPPSSWPSRPGAGAAAWRLTIRQPKFLVGAARAFRFSAIRTADGASASATVARDVVAA